MHCFITLVSFDIVHWWQIKEGHRLQALPCYCSRLALMVDFSQELTYLLRDRLGMTWNGWVMMIRSHTAAHRANCKGSVCCAPPGPMTFHHTFCASLPQVSVSHIRDFPHQFQNQVRVLPVSGKLPQTLTG